MSGYVMPEPKDCQHEHRRLRWSCDNCGAEWSADAVPDAELTDEEAENIAVRLWNAIDDHDCTVEGRHVRAALAPTEDWSCIVDASSMNLVLSGPEVNTAMDVYRAAIEAEARRATLTIVRLWVNRAAVLAEIDRALEGETP